MTETRVFELPIGLTRCSSCWAPAQARLVNGPEETDTKIVCGTCGAVSWENLRDLRGVSAEATT